MSTPANQLRDFTRRLMASIEGAARPDVMRQMGDQAAVIIRRRARLGYGVPDGTNGTAERFDLPELAASTVAKRERYSDELSDQTRPGRSNLTATGQMLDSVQTVSASQGNAIVAPTGGRRRSKLDSGRLSNAAVAGYVTAAGRPFMALSRLEVAQLIRFFRNTFGDLLRNNRIK